MKPSNLNETESSARMLDHFYRIFLGICLLFLLVGVPFVFYRKAVSAALCVTLAVSVLACWRMSRRGAPQKSLKIFASGMWIVLVALLYAGLPPVTATTAMAMALMLAVVVNLRAGVLFGASYMLAWLLYLGLGSANLAPAPYFTASPLTSWFISAAAVWLVLLPSPSLVRNLRKAASLHHAVVEAATDGILVVSKLGKVESYNGQFIRLWGLPTDLVQRGDDAALLEFVTQLLQDPTQFLQKVRELYEHPDRSSFDVLRFKDGRVFERHSNPEYLDGQVVGRVWSFRDVTERETAQENLRQLNEQFEAILNATTESIFLVDRCGTILAINATAAQRIGRQPADMIAKCVFDFFPTGVASARRANLDQVFATGQARYTEDTRADRSFSLNYYPVSGPNAQVHAVVVFAADITQRKRDEIQLKTRQSRLNSLMASMQDTILVFDLKGQVVECICPSERQPPALQPVDGVISGKTCTELMPSQAAQLFNHAMTALAEDSRPQTFDYTLEFNREQFEYVGTMSRIADDSGYLCVIRDVTARRTARREIERLGQRNKLLLESVGEGIFDVDLQGRVTFANAAALGLLGLTETQMLGQDQHALFQHHTEAGQPYSADQSPIQLVLADGQRRQLESEWFWRQDGTGFPVSMTVNPIVEEDRRVGVVVVFQDATERRKTQAQIHLLAFHDALTKLPNRRLLQDRLGQLMADCKRSGRFGAVVFLDLDNFKPLNDVHGHGVGDLLLVEVARRITACVREMDTVARFGGDEFVVLLGKLDADPRSAHFHARQIAEKIRQALALPYHLVVPREDGDDTHVHHDCTASLGVALFSDQDASIEDVLKSADTAMYYAKESGRNAVIFHGSSVA